MRPQSIINFERLFLGSMVLGVVAIGINWSAIQAQVSATPGAEILAPWFLPVTLIVGFAINLLLWFFVARRGAVAAKWILIVFFAIGLMSLPGAIYDGTPAMQLIPGLINTALQAAAIWMLFKPDASLWFAGERDDFTETFR